MAMVLLLKIEEEGSFTIEHGGSYSDADHGITVHSMLDTEYDDYRSQTIVTEDGVIVTDDLLETHSTGRDYTMSASTSAPGISSTTTGSG